MAYGRPSCTIDHGDNDRDLCPIALLERELPYLRRYARMLCGNSHSADDLVQSAILRAIENIDKWQAGTNMRAWATTIVRNTHFNNWRRQKTEAHVLAQRKLSMTNFTPPSQDDAIAVSDLRRCLAMLSPDHQEILHLIVVDGLTYEDVAEVLGIEMGTVKSRLYRARTMLADLMSGARRETRRRVIQDQLCASLG